MTSSDREFFILLFDGVNKRLDILESGQQDLAERVTRLESQTGELAGRVSKLETRVEKLEQTTGNLSDRINDQHNLLFGGIAWFTLIFTAAMFLQLFRRDKTEAPEKDNSEQKSLFTLEAVKELINIIRHE